MIRIEDRIKSLEVAQELTKGKLRKMFEVGEETQEKLFETDNAVLELQKSVDELMRKVNVEVDRLIKLEEIVESLKSQSHTHKIVM
ncbi:MAG: hypothetical protein RRZ69_05590 [Clostridia bacterium]